MDLARHENGDYFANSWENTISIITVITPSSLRHVMCSSVLCVPICFAV